MFLSTVEFTVTLLFKSFLKDKPQTQVVGFWFLAFSQWKSTQFSLQLSIVVFVDLLQL